MMSRARSHQPDTVASLKRKLAEKDVLLAEKEALLIERERVIAVRDAELYSKTLQIEHIKAQLAVLRRARFGRSSEKLDCEIEQLELVLGELEEGVAESKERAARAQADARSGGRRKNTDRKPFGRKPLPDHLPRERVVHEPPLACSSCSGTALRKIGEDVTEVLEYVPS
jgi:transposase